MGVADHTGWAYLVCVSVHGGIPLVVERRRVTLIDAGLPTQPYEHDSLAMREDDANAMIARVRQSIAARTNETLQRLVSELAPAHEVVAVAIRQPPFAELPETVAEAWASNRLRYAADGMMYHLAICRAARQLGLEVALCRRGEETAQAARQLGAMPGDVDAFVGGPGRPAGPPWTQEHRRAYAAAMAALATHVRGGLRLPRP